MKIVLITLLFTTLFVTFFIWGYHFGSTEKVPTHDTIHHYHETIKYIEKPDTPYVVAIYTYIFLGKESTYTTYFKSENITYNQILDHGNEYLTWFFGKKVQKLKINRFATFPNLQEAKEFYKQIDK